MFADCIVSLLNAWKVTVVRTERDDAASQLHFFRKVSSNHVPLEKKFVDYTHYCESSISLEGGVVRTD